LKKALLFTTLSVLVAVAVALALPGPPPATPVTASPGVEVQLGFVLDASNSISSSNWTTMKNGLAAAINDASFPKDGTIELTVVEFGTNWTGNDAKVVVGPVVITAANATTVANTIQGLSQAGGYTPLAAGIYLVGDTLYNSSNYSAAIKQAINIVTDGEPNRCSPSGSNYYEGTNDNCCGSQTTNCTNARNSAVTARNYVISKLGMTADQDEIDVEGVGITNTNRDWLRDNIVYPQPGVLAPPYPTTHNGWVQVISSYSDFPAAILAKIQHVICTLLVSLSGNASFCAGSSTLITANVSGGTGTITYDWSASTASGTPSGNTYTATGSGKVEVTVTDSKGCQDTDSMTVTVNALPNCTITAPASVCANSTGNTASAAAGFSSYTWSVTGNGALTGGQGTNSITFSATSAGSLNISLTVVDSNGCSNTCNKSVTINALPNCTITAPASVCANSTGNTASAAAGFVSYTWSVTGNGTLTGGQGTNSITWSAGAAGSANISLTVVDSNGCSNTCNKSVTVNALPSCTITAPASVCANSTGNTASAAAGFSSYTWSVTGNGTLTGGQGTSSITWSAGGAGTANISLTVVDSNGCSNTCNKSVTVNALPNCTITAPASVCANSTGNTASAAAGFVSYTWSVTGNGALTGGQGTNSITWSAGAAGSANISLTVVDSNGCSNTCNKSVTVNALPDCTITAPASVCANSTGNTASAAAGFVSYTWSVTGNGTLTGGQGTNSITWSAGAAGSANISLTVVDSNGCSNTCNKSVTVGALPDCTITAPASVCANSTGNTASVPAQGGVTYLWSVTGNGTLTGGQGTNSITWSAGASGTVNISVTVSNGSGCSNTCNKSVTVNALPNCTITAPASVCANSTGNTASAAAGFVSYTWSVTGNGALTGGQGTNSITWSAGAAGSANISLTVVDSNGCSNTCNKSVTVNALPDCTITAPASVCANSTGNTASAAAGFVSYTWSVTGNGTLTGGQGTNSITWSAGGAGTANISLTVVDSNGCSNTCNKSVTVGALPDCTITAPASVCANSMGNTASVPAQGGMTYTWSVTGNGALTGGQGTNSITWSAGAAGIANISVTVSNGSGCSNTCNKSVTINAKPTVSVANVTVCQSALPATISATTNASSPSYKWTVPAGASDPGNVASFQTSVAGQYCVEVTDGVTRCKNSGCGTLTINPSPIAYAGPDRETLCGEGPVVIGGSPTASGGTPPYTYSWTPSVVLDDPTSPNPSTSAAGTYTVVVTDANGCQASDSVVVTVIGAPTVDAGPDVCIAQGGSVQIGGSPTASGGEPPYTYSWTPMAGLDDPTLANPIASPSSTTTYTVLVTDSKGCQAVDSVVVAVTTSDVGVTKSDNPDPLTAGSLQPLTYTITVTNYGPLTAEGVLLTDSIPVQVQNPEYSLDGGSTWNPWTGSISLGTMGAGESRQVLIQGTVDPSFIGQFCNTAVVSSTTPDCNLANNQDMECTDVIPPPPGCTLELICAADITIQCGESTDPSNTGWAIAIGNCPAVVTYSDSISGTCPIITRTWTATDDFGNTVSCTQIITIVDNTPPVLTVPADVDVGYGQSTDPSHTGWATATDNCDPNPEVTYSDSWCWVCCSAQLTRTWTATDRCGNSTSAVQKITAPDNTPPVLSIPPDVTIEYGISLPPGNTGGWATAIDDRDPNPTVIYRDTYSGTCPTIVTRTWIATDGSGNMASAVQMITLVDTTAPELTVPADITIGFGQSTSPFNTGGWATAIDNFDPSPEIAYSDSFSGTCPVTITRTWTATDCCGNSASTVQRITVVDTTPPVLNVPASVAIEYGQSTAPADLGWATAVDNFDPSPEIAYSDSSSGTYPTVITRTWTATDSCGNSASAVQTLTLVDTTRPVLTLPADITIGKGESTAPSHTGWATATDIADPSPVITYVDSVSVKHISRVWTATDASGNSASGIQTITIGGGGFPLWAIALIALAGFLLALLLVLLVIRRERRKARPAAAA
jgi:uncharacterized repeat protein (TIGR01451 family)